VAGSQGNVMASEKSTRVWEAAYRQYGRAWEWTARCGKADPAAAKEMAWAALFFPDTYLIAMSCCGLLV
jgi:hypothetical protein